ncbi:MAG: bifunctional 2-methylcitrate synthase/citrate synthase [Proteobacteria bacterium]|nr:bifunctional 2-methylcitrate synthase/citrate synthase [Pseudomonadota bacterium]
MTEEPEIKKGLAGVVVDDSAISKVMPETNSLTYRGYAVQDLAENCGFEEVAYLLWNGELPTRGQLAAFVRRERAERGLSRRLLEAIKAFPTRKVHPMDTLRTAVSHMGLEDPDRADNGAEANRAKAMRLLAKIPTAVAADYRHRKGKRAIAPRRDLSFAANFFHMCFGTVPAKEIVKAFDVSLILYAEHTFNASTFTARVITSSMADMHSAVTGAIGSLKGPLHGGANEAVMHVLKEIGSPDRAAAWLDRAFQEKRLVMGFGHRVYKTGDSRVPTMTKYARLVADRVGDSKWLEIEDILARKMIAEKAIHPNLDFPTGPAYYMMGFDIDLFTPIFVMSRITGWTAHIMEQWADNRLIRPLSHYTGPAERPLVPMKERR